MPEPASQELEQAVWSALNTEPKQIAYLSLSDSWRPSHPIASGFEARTGYPIRTDTIDAYLQDFQNVGLVDARARGPPEQIHEWKLGPEGSRIQAVAYWLVKYAVENNTSTATYLGKRKPYEALQILDALWTGVPASEFRKSLEQSSTELRSHFQTLQQEGLVDFTLKSPTHCPEIDGFKEGAVLPVRRYLAGESSQEMSSQVGFFDHYPSVARHYQQMAVNLYLLRGSRLMANMDFGGWMKQMRLERGMGVRQFAGELGYSHTLISRTERGKEKPSDEFWLRVCDYFGIQDDFQSWITSKKVQKRLPEILNPNPNSVSLLLSLDK